METPEIQDIIDQIMRSSELDNEPRKIVPVVDNYISRGSLPNGKPLHADEGMILRKFARLIDDEPDPIRAREIARDVSSSGAFQPPTEFDEKLKGVAKNLHSATVAFTCENKAASGTAIRIEDRVFIATAAHTIPPSPSGKITFVPPLSTNIDECTPQILSYGKCPDIRPDVGYIELVPCFVSDILHCDGITLDRITPSGAGKPDTMCFLAGYPSDEIAQTKQPDATEFVFTCQIYSNLPIMPQDWNLVTQSKKPEFRGNPEIDIYLPYPTSERMRSLMALRSNNLSIPRGLSGGGLWQPLRGDESSIWSPENYGLIGIQSMWPQEGRFLQASQIIHWISLIWNERKELRKTLQEAFQGFRFPIATPGATGSASAALPEREPSQSLAEPVAPKKPN